VGRASLRFAAGHNLGREKPVNADFLPAFLALARSSLRFSNGRTAIDFSGIVLADCAAV
jgi:hypothetical protein